MLPEDVLRVAATLATHAGERLTNGHNDEAEWRSVVSRAYYAALRSAVVFSQILGESMTRSKNVHKDTSTLLQYCGGDLKKVGSLLVTLCEDRNAADYGLDGRPNHQDWAKVGRKSLMNSEMVIKTLKTASGSTVMLDAARASIQQKRDALNAAAKPPLGGKT